MGNQIQTYNQITAPFDMMKLYFIIFFTSLSLVASQDKSEEEFEKIRETLLKTAENRANDVTFDTLQNIDDFEFLYVEDAAGRIENDETLLVHSNGTITALHLTHEKPLVFLNRNGEFEIDDDIFNEVFPGFDQYVSTPEPEQEPEPEPESDGGIESIEPPPNTTPSTDSGAPQFGEKVFTLVFLIIAKKLFV